MEGMIGMLGGLTTETMIFLGSGLLGMVGHYGKKRIKEQTSIGIVDYFGKNNPFSSIATFATYAGSMSGMIFGLDISALDPTVVVILGAACGWTIDSSINTVKED